MRLSLLAPVLYLLGLVSSSTTTGSSSSSSSITLYAAPLTGTQPAAPHPYAMIYYDPTTLTGGTLSRSASSLKTSTAKLVKLGLYDRNTAQWLSAVVTSLENLNEKMGTLVLHLGKDGKEVVRVSYEVGGAGGGGEEVRVVKAEGAPRPVLNGPVKLDEQGRVPVPEVEKTFLQKYWWIFLTIAFVAITTGGGDEK